MKKKSGFTLIELVVVLVIIGILSIVAVPMYRGYVSRAMAAEGRALLGSVAASEKIYYAEHGGYFVVGNTGFDVTLDVDARMNTYFQTYSVACANANASGFQDFTGTANGTGEANNIVVTFAQTANNPPTITVVYP